MSGVDFHHEHDAKKSQRNSSPASKFRWYKFIVLLTLLYGPSIYVGLNWEFSAFLGVLFISVGLLMAYNGLRYTPAERFPRLSLYFFALGSIFIGMSALCKFFELSVFEMIFCILGMILSGIGIPFMLRKRFQFTLRTMFIVVTAVALLIGIISSYPVHIGDLQIPCIAVRSKSVDLTHTMLHLDFSTRWGQTRIHVEAENGFDKKVKAELFWLESDTFHHMIIADKGNRLVTDYSIPSQHPLVLGVIVYHSKINHIRVRMIPRLVINDGLDETLDSDDPLFNGGIEKWGPKFLKKIQKRIP
ncbi:MAG: hypothetical protein JXB10_11260 [Pirellulales bacterium]|nr:hypothetical protein [Pirellulales bacterium]